MPQNKIRIDPTLPVIWESIDCLRIGFDTALVRIENPSAAAQRLLNRLQRGILLNTLSTVAHETGCTPAERDKIQYLCSPVMVSDANLHSSTVIAQPQQTSRILDSRSAVTLIAVLGHYRSRAQVVSTLRCRGFHIHPARTIAELHEAENSPQIILVLERFWATTPLLHGLMQLGIPHLILRFSDQSITVGPVIYPGQTPCGVCMQFSDSQQDRALPILAAQLLRSLPATELPQIVDFASVVACMLLCRTITPAANDQSRKFVYHVSRGTISLMPDTVTYTVEPECGCQAVIDVDNSDSEVDLLTDS